MLYLTRQAGTLYIQVLYQNSERQKKKKREKYEINPAGDTETARRARRVIVGRNEVRR